MPKILVTTYKGNDSIDTWLISYLWGLIFVFAQEYNVYDHRKFRLFTISTLLGTGQFVMTINFMNTINLNHNPDQRHGLSTEGSESIIHKYLNAITFLL